jgi:hypothetical protein
MPVPEIYGFLISDDLGGPSIVRRFERRALTNAHPQNSNLSFAALLSEATWFLAIAAFYWSIRS